jgi:hypothetical protein
MDLSNQRSILILNIIAIGLLFPGIYLFDNLVNKMRPELTNYSTFTLKLSLANIFSIILVVLTAILIHELIHGVFFWIYTGERPQFAFKILYAFAAAPEWYIPKTKFIIIGLSPVILISSCVILLLIFIPPNLVKYLTIAGIFNFVGSTGDLLVITWLLLQPKDCLIIDSGDSFSVYINKSDFETPLSML